MRVAVLTLTRDRLDYTKHCFATLHEHAGCDFDHHVIDQASTDGTASWLLDEYRPAWVGISPTNLGISRGLNRLLSRVVDRGYDVIVKIDNDCELTMPNTLRDVCRLTVETGALLSPRVLGLLNPPPVVGRWEHGGETILDVPQIGGIFLAAPAGFYNTFRYDDAAPTWGTDDVLVCQHHRARGGRVGYVERLSVNHYEGTAQQRATYPQYWERKAAEMGIPA